MILPSIESKNLNGRNRKEPGGENSSRRSWKEIINSNRKNRRICKTTSQEVAQMLIKWTCLIMCKNLTLYIQIKRTSSHMEHPHMGNKTVWQDKKWSRVHVGLSKSESWPTNINDRSAPFRLP